MLLLHAGRLRVWQITLAGLHFLIRKAGCSLMAFYGSADLGLGLVVSMLEEKRLLAQHCACNG